MSQRSRAGTFKMLPQVTGTARQPRMQKIFNLLQMRDGIYLICTGTYSGCALSTSEGNV